MTINKYVQIAKINFANSFVYTFDVLSRAGFIALIIYIFSCMWKVIYASGNSMYGFTIATVIWYLVMTEAIATSLSKVVEEIGDEIKSGSIANYLNKPYNYIAYKYSSAIGIAMYKFMFIFLFGGIVAYITVGGFAFSWTALIPVAICAFLAITLDFVIMATLGIFAFWFEDARALSFLYQKFLFTIGGMLIPLEFFPDWLAYVSKFLPFSYISYAPAKLFVSYSFTAFINTALFQIMWIFIFLILSYVLYRFCEKRLSVNGG